MNHDSQRRELVPELVGLLELAAHLALEPAPVRKSISESGARPCWLERAVIDHNATPSSWRCVDGGGHDLAVAETRRDNLIYALAGT